MKRRSPGSSPLPEEPVCHSAPTGRDVPLIFAGDAAPELDSLAAGVRARMGNASQDAPLTALPAAPGGPFGSRQRWSLTRLRWSAPEDSPLVLVRRTLFISDDEVASWRVKPPDDALALPCGTTDLVDGQLEDERTAFYVVLAQVDGWRPLPISPVPAPYTPQGSPYHLGDVPGRLSAVVERRVEQLQAAEMSGADLLVALDLVEGLLSSIPEDAREPLLLKLEHLRAGATP